jgi:hypothetical protein
VYHGRLSFLLIFRVRVCWYVARVWVQGLAFALDPDGYWLEIIKRPVGTGIVGFCCMSALLSR